MLAEVTKSKVRKFISATNTNRLQDNRK